MIWAGLLHIYQPPHWDARVIDRVVRESYRPIVDILKRNPGVRITLNINASLTEQLAQLGYQYVISGLREVAERGQIEFTGSAKYHPILPLIPANEVRRQIELNTETNRALFGKCYAPVGFFPPEMAINLDVVALLVELGFRWVALDEVVSAEKADGSTWGTIAPFDLTAILRNRRMSDYLSFVAPADNPQDFFSEFGKTEDSKALLITSFDGENLGHHRPGTDHLWEKIVTDPSVKTLTYSQLLDLPGPARAITLRPSSWSTRDEDLKHGAAFPLWQNPDNQLHSLQWSLTHLTIDAVSNSDRRGDTGYASARLLLDEALASDQYWWASATPWWSVEIVTGGAERFVKIIDSLVSLPEAERREAHQLAGAITRLARQWQDDGTAQVRREQYLKAAQTVHYLGGDRIDASRA